MKIYQRTFQTEYPTFVKRDFMAHGRRWKRGQEFTWKSFGISAEKVEWLYKRGFLYHKDIAEKVVPKRVEPVAKTETDDLDSMNKNELIEFARDLELQANNTLSKDELKSRIRSALQV